MAQPVDRLRRHRLFALRFGAKIAREPYEYYLVLITELDSQGLERGLCIQNLRGDL